MAKKRFKRKKTIKNPNKEICKCGNTSWLCECSSDCKCGCSTRNPHVDDAYCNRCNKLVEEGDPEFYDENGNIYCEDCKDAARAHFDALGNENTNPIKSFEERITLLKKKAADGDIPSIQKLQIIKKVWKRAKEGNKKAIAQIKAWKTKYKVSKYETPNQPQVIKDLTPEQANIEFKNIEQKVQNIYQDIWEKAQQFPEDFEKYKETTKKLFEIQAKKMDEIIARIDYSTSPKNIDW